MPTTARKRRKTPPAAKPTSIADVTAARGWWQRELWLIEASIRGRWTYWLGTLLNGRLGPLPDWQIPQIRFSGIEYGPERPDLPSTPWGCSQPLSAELIEQLGTRSEARRHTEQTFREVFASGVHLRDAIAWWLWGFGSWSLDKRPALPERAERALYAWQWHRCLAHPGDWGAYIATLFWGEKGGRHCGWFPTPIAVCELMARLSFEALPDADLRAKATHDGCVGTGALLLPASNHSLNLSAGDIDPTMCALCEWQGWLFMPWLVYGDRSAVREIREANQVQQQEAA